MKKKVLYGVLVVGTLAILSVLLLIFNKNVNEDGLKFKQEYESLNGKVNEYNSKKYMELSIPKDNPIKLADASDIVKLMEEESTFVVYFGFKECPSCRSVVEPLMEAAKESEIDVIYYVDVKDIRDTYILDENNNPKETKKGSEDYYKLLTYFNDVLYNYSLYTKDGKEVKTEMKRIYSPNIISVLDGMPKTLTIAEPKGYNDHYKNMTKKQFKECKNDILKVLEEVVTYSSTCGMEKPC